MNTNNKIRNPHIAALILATASTSYAYSSRANLPSTSSWINTACTAAAAVAGAIAVVGLLRKQCDERGFKVGGGPCGRGGGGGSTSEKRKGSCCDDTSDTISVEGSVMVTLPTWAIAASEDFFSRKYHTDIEMMSLAIHLSDRNISEGTGGPFGAAIFERHPDKGYCTLVSIGMNRVVPLGNSTLHGETVAIQLAQRRVGSYTLMLDEDGNSSDGGEDGLFWDEGEGGVAGDGEGKKEENKEEEAASAGGDGGKAGAEAGSKKEKRKRQFELFTSCEPCAMCLGATLWSGVSRMVCGATKDDAQSIGFDEGPVFEESYKHLERMGCKVTRNIMREEAASVLRRYGNSGLIYNR